MFFGFRRNRWWVWASTFLLVVLTTWEPYPSTGETLRFHIGLTDQLMSTELQDLRSHHVIVTSKRTSSAMVVTIMTLLATFDEAGVLPPEGTAQANQVIHGLIQLQSALMKSSSDELAAYRNLAVAHWISQHKDLESAMLGDKGLTGRVLAALIVYDVERSLWHDSKIELVMQSFNVTRADWIVLVDLFHQAEAVFREQARSFHMVYEGWRVNLSDSKPTH